MIDVITAYSPEPARFINGCESDIFEEFAEESRHFAYVYGGTYNERSVGMDFRQIIFFDPFEKIHTFIAQLFGKLRSKEACVPGA